MNYLFYGLDGGFFDYAPNVYLIGHPAYQNFKDNQAFSNDLSRDEKKCIFAKYFLRHFNLIKEGASDEFLQQYVSAYNDLQKLLESSPLGSDDPPQHLALTYSLESDQPHTHQEERITRTREQLEDAREDLLFLAVIGFFEYWQCPGKCNVQVLSWLDRQEYFSDIIYDLNVTYA